MQTEYQIRNSVVADAKIIGDLFDEARQFMAKNGLNQWQYGYPNAQTAEEDARAGIGRVLLYGDEIVGTAVFLDYEPDYDTLRDGAWLQNGSYLAVHRVACKASFRGKGVGTALLTYAAAEAVKQGAVSLRIDTHEENIPMRSLLEKNGFRLCGNLKLTRSNEWRVGYEKLL